MYWRWQIYHHFLRLRAQLIKKCLKKREGKSLVNFTVLQIGKVIFFSTSSWGAWHSRNWEICNHRFLERNLLKERWKSETRKKYTRGFDLMKVDRKYEMNNGGRTFLKSFFNFLIFYRSPKLVRLDQKSWAWLIRKIIKDGLSLSNSDFRTLTLIFVEEYMIH